MTDRISPTLVGGDSFNLVDRAWIQVRFVSGQTQEISLRDVFHQAREIRSLAGETPTQSFAILRLLLAILHRTHGEPITTETYSSWVKQGLPVDDIDDYLAEWHDRFNLFDADRPFFQVADLHTKSGDHKDVVPLIADLPSNNRLFTNRSGIGAVSLSYAEAARWLVHAQAFDVSGIKSGAVGDPRVKGGKGYPLGIAWSGHLGGVYAQGASLLSTLLLNLAPRPSSVDDLDADLPPWEDVQPDTSSEREGLAPCGPVRLFTWQSRRVRLFSDGEFVTGCLVTNGDRLTPQNMQQWEPMTAWRYSDPQTKKLKQNTYMPREHLPGRALWRGISALLPGMSPLVPKKEIPHGLEPGVISWLSELENAGLADPTMPIQLRAVGLVYGSQSSVIDDIIDDQVLFPLALLATRNRALARQAEEAVQLADAGVRAVRNLVENIERAAGGTGEARASGAMESAWAALDGPYRTWLRGLTDNTDPLDAIEKWKTIARAVLRTIGEEFVNQAGPVAWTGREVSRLGRTELVNTPRAESWFFSALTKTFGKPVRKDEAA